VRFRAPLHQSLKGSTRNQFTDGILVHAGLYAITGQTGAGKSAILDTMALYGKINRYGNEKPSSDNYPQSKRGLCRGCFFFKCNDIVYLARWAASFNI
jgi:DNA repair exonuclease SbcCD ATPase subunit